jgi:predicted DNA-binding transcriptional regulator AlpA
MLEQNKDLTDRYLTDKEIYTQRKISRAHWWNMVRKGLAPKPIKFGAASRWSAQEIADWEAKLKANAA